MKTRKSTFIIILGMLIFFANTLSGQEKKDENRRFRDKIFFGGSIGLMIGEVTRIDVLPVVGMWVLPEWSLGVAGRYSYHRQRAGVIGAAANVYQTHIWGVSGFTQILPIPDFHKAFGVDIRGGIIFHGEYEGMYLDRSIADPFSEEESGKGWINMYLLGGGWHQIIGERSAINILVLWDLTSNDYSPYSTNPILRLSLTF